jgi:ribosomal protein S18 acetylase RimI-like enzyme
MATTPDLRVATSSDLEALFALYRTVFQSHIERLWGWSEAWQRSNFKKDLESSSTTVVELAGRVVGYLQTEEDKGRLYLRNLALLPDLQGQGMGTDLVEGLQRRAKQAGLPVELVVFRTNPRALEFYRRLGFEVRGKSEEFIEMSWQASGPR